MCVFCLSLWLYAMELFFVLFVFSICGIYECGLRYIQWNERRTNVNKLKSRKRNKCSTSDSKWLCFVVFLSILLLLVVVLMQQMEFIRVAIIHLFFLSCFTLSFISPLTSFCFDLLVLLLLFYSILNIWTMHKVGNLRPKPKNSSVFRIVCCLIGILHRWR